jgi:hypothetical protein
MNRKTSRPSAPPVADRGQASTPEEPTGHYGPGYGDPTPVDPSKEPAGHPDASRDAPDPPGGRRGSRPSPG